ncbi:MAG: hypothetical protein K2L08_03780, partial [Erysipelotrichaceae bacterium]|nr:hypothetical protein [Erysipelotrichaceae bacterium]
MKHKYKKKVKIASAVALSTAIMVNSAGSIFAENEKQTEEYSVESYEEKVETIEKSNENVETKTAEDIPITEEYFPDETFRNFVKEQFDTNKNDILEKVELDAVTKISFFHIDANKVETLKGIEHFQNLEEVRAEYKSFAMEEADFSKNPKLKKLIFTGSDVKRVNVSGTQVNYLDLTRSKNLEVINLGENPSAHFEEFRIAAAPNLREIIGFDKIEGMTSLNIEQMYYEKGHSNYGVYEVGIKGFDLTHIRVGNLRLSAGSHVEMPMTLAWLHLGDTTGGFIYLNKNKDSVVEIDKKGTPLAECDTDLEFKIQDKFPGMDPSRAWVLEENGLSYNKTTGEVIRTRPEVKYQYDCGTWNGATIWLNVTLRFTPYNNIFNPQANRITISKGEALPDATTAIANLADMPEDTTFTWKGSIDTNTVGEQVGSIQVTYPDGTKENIDVTVNVVDGDVSDADRYTPVINTAGITTYKDEIPTPEKIKEVITNANTFPENTAYAWKSIDVSTLGETTGIATVTYPDRSTDEVEIKVNVIEYNPGNNADIYEAETKQITLDQGVVPDNAQIEEGIVNKDALPVGTKYEWQEVDTTTPGEKEAKIKVVYPDGSVDENVVMPVRV